MTNRLAPARGPRPGRRWVKLGNGLYRPTGGPEPTSRSGQLHQDLLAWRLVLPDSAAFTHLTAAEEYGLWLPPLPGGLPLFVCMSRQQSRPQRPELRIARHRAAPERVLLDEVPLAVVAEVLLACAVHLRLLDVIALCDAALHLKLCTLAELQTVAGLRRRGAPLLRIALKYVDGRSESIWETLLRMLHVICDVPVVPQAVITTDDGGFVAQGDLLIVGTRTLHEYDGGDHLPRRRQRKDLKRHRRLDHVSFTRRGYTSEDVLHQAVGILRDADAALGRSHRPERIRKWHALLADSLFTPSGTARFLGRLRLPVDLTRAG